jgi:hypothetical protein
VLPQISQVDQHDANGSMQHPDAEAVIPSSNQATRCKCDAPANHQDVQVSRTGQQDTLNVSVVLPSVSHVEQQDANGSLPKPDAESIFPNTDQANVDNFVKL